MRTFTRSPIVVAPSTNTTSPSTFATPSVSGFFDDASLITTSSTAPSTTNADRSPGSGL